MPLQATSGAASYDAFGGGVPVVPAYIEEVFQTWLYTGNTNTQTITNGIDLSGKGGLTWIKERSGTAYHSLFDTVRGAGNPLFSNTTNAQDTDGAFTAFTSTGFSLGTYFGGGGFVNTSGSTYASWTFRKQPKFFDVVTYTGDGTASRNISHALGSKPGFVVIKRTDNTGNWFVAAWSGTTFFVGLDSSPFALNSTNGYNTPNGAAATTTTFDPNEVTISSNYGVTPSNANINGATYVAYLFAHNAGGFGLTGTDNVISCGTFTGNTTVTLGYEPQWILVKKSSGAGDWYLQDNMRGWPVSGDAAYLLANSSAAEGQTSQIYPNATGFSTAIGSGDYIYIAIRRGPMKVPTDATKVFDAEVISESTTPPLYPNTINAGFVVDAAFEKFLPSDGNNRIAARLMGSFQMNTNNTSAEFANPNDWASNTTATMAAANGSAGNTVMYAFQRAPSFMDVVCYTGTGTYGASNHNLGVTPELVIYKSRSNAVNWGVIKPVSSIAYYDGLLNSNSAFTYYSNDPSVAGLYTSTQFAKYQDTSSYTYVAYLFATCAGVSKVGSYTGNGTTQTIDCGFTGGARFVLIKRTDSTGDWYVWDSARGIVSGNDPYLLLNSTAAEVTSTDYVDTYSAGFEISSTAPAAINASGGSFIFLAIS
jgi:hypothetical protein